jgi:hypothetical protein
MSNAHTLSDDVRLNVTVIVLAGPHETAIGLKREGDHVVDQAVLVPLLVGLELRLVLPA